MCYDTSYSGLYDHCSGGCCDKTTDKFCCYYIGPVLGITVAGAVIISIIVITICCYRRQKGAPGVVLSQENIYPEVVIEPCKCMLVCDFLLLFLCCSNG